EPPRNGDPVGRWLCRTRLLRIPPPKDSRGLVVSSDFSAGEQFERFVGGSEERHECDYRPRLGGRGSGPEPGVGPTGHHHLKKGGVVHLNSKYSAARVKRTLSPAVARHHEAATAGAACVMLGGYRVRPEPAAPSVSRSRPNASTGPRAPVPRRPPSSAVRAPQARIAAVKS